MAIRFRRVSRLCDPTNKEAGKKVYPVISYQEVREPEPG